MKVNEEEEEEEEEAKEKEEKEKKKKERWGWGRRAFKKQPPADRVVNPKEKQQPNFHALSCLRD